MNNCEPCISQSWINIVWQHWTSATMINTDDWLVYSDFPTEVTSIDWSVSVIKQTENTDDWLAKTITYDLSVECCDERAKVCWESEAKFLKDSIQATSPITKSINCDNGTITIGLDTANLVNKNYTDCNDNVITESDTIVTSQSLADIIRLSEWYTWYNNKDLSVWEEIINRWECETGYIWPKCNIEWDDIFTKQAMQLRLNQTIVQQQEAWPQWQWLEKFRLLVAWTSSWQFNGISATVTNASWKTDIKYWALKKNNGWIEIWRNWLYRISFRWNFEATWWVNGIKLLLFKVDADTGDVSTVLESRYSPTSDPTNGSRPPDNYWTSAGWSTWPNAWFRYMERFPFAWDNLIELSEWDVVFFGVKVSSVIDDPDYDANRNAEFAILWKEWIAWWNSNDLWASFYIESIDDTCIASSLA